MMPGWHDGTGGMVRFNQVQQMADSCEIELTGDPLASKLNDHVFNSCLRFSIHHLGLQSCTMLKRDLIYRVVFQMRSQVRVPSGFSNECKMLKIVTVNCEIDSFIQDL